jgi:Xaa-Pro aminopeptidase
MIPYSSKVPYDYDTIKSYIDVPFPESEYEGRVEKIRMIMLEKDLSALLVFSNPAGGDGAGHLTYLSGFMPMGGNAVLLLPLDGEATIIFDRIFHGEPTHSQNWTTWIKDVWPSTRDNIALNIQSWIKERKLDTKKIGIVGEKMLPYDIWAKTLSLLLKVKWVPETQSFNDVQKIKSDNEMHLIKKVCCMTNEGMKVGVETVRPGITEGEVIAKVEAKFFEEGAHDLSFTSICCSGPRSGVKHSYPTSRKIQNGDLVYIDVGARYYGYYTDMSRVIMVGKPTQKQKELLDYNSYAYYTLLDAMKPGVSVTEIYKLAEEIGQKSGVYEKYGKDAYIGLSDSHGMSTGFAEWSLRDNRTIIIPNLSPLAFEPMFVILNVGTIVIESMVGFTNKGAEVLTPYKLDWM